MYLENREGKRLYYKKEGQGKPLLLIHGAAVDADYFEVLSSYLSRKYCVMTYDRRGASRSETAEDYSLEAQTRDAADVLRALADAPALVVGCSLGALIAMRLMATEPALVERLFLHELPAMFFPEIQGTEEMAECRKMCELVEQGKARRALLRFLLLMNGESDERAVPHTPEKIDQQMKNGTLYMQHEFAEFFFAPEEAFSLPALNGKKICCLIGDSKRNSLFARSAELLAERLDCPVRYVPGGHNAPYDLPLEFACVLLGLLELEGE